MEDLKKWDNYSVSKTPEVLDIIKYDLPLECFKIVDIYLSKINPQGIRDIEKEYFDKIAALPKDFEDEKLKEKIFSEYLQERYMKIRRWALVSLDKEDFCTLTGKNPKSFRKRDIDNLLKKICGLCRFFHHFCGAALRRKIILRFGIWPEFSISVHFCEFSIRYFNSPIFSKLTVLKTFSINTCLSEGYHRIKNLKIYFI